MYCKYLVTLVALLSSFGLIAQIGASELEQLTYSELDSLKKVESAQGHYKEALVYIEAGLQRSKREFGKEDSIYLEWLEGYAFLNMHLGEFKIVETCYLEMIGTQEKLFGKDGAETAIVMANLADAYVEMGRMEEAEALLVKAMKIQENVLGEKDPEYVNTLVSLGTFYYQLGKLDDCAELFQQVVQLRRKIHGAENPNYLIALNNMSVCYMRMGQYESAEPLLRAALKVQKKVLGVEHPEYANTLGNLGNLYQFLDKYDAAETLHLQELEIKKKIFGEEHKAYFLGINNLAALYQNSNKFKKAEALHLQNIKIRKKVLGETHPDYAQSLSNLGAMYIDMKRFEDAEKLLKKGLEIREKVLGETHHTCANSLSTLSVLYEEMGRLNEIEPLLLRVLDISKEVYGENSIKYGEVLGTLAQLYRKLGDFPKAMDYAHQKIIALCKTCDSTIIKHLETMPQEEFITTKDAIMALRILRVNYQLLYDSLGNQNDLEKAAQVIDIAMELNEKSRNSFSSDKDKLRTLKEMSHLVNFGINTCLEMSIDGDKRALIHKAFSYAEQNKSILLTDALKGNRARILGDLPDSLAFKEIKLKRKKKKLLKAELETKDVAAKQVVRNQLNELNREIDDFMKLLRAKYPKYHQLKYQHVIAKVEDVQAVLTAKSMLIEYFSYKDSTYIFAITKDGVDLVAKAISQQELKRQIKQLRKALSNYKFIFDQEVKAMALYGETAHWFYKELLAPVLIGKDIKNLIIVSDGELGHLPFEAFLVEQPNQGEKIYNDLHYLVQDYNVSYNYSATLFVDGKKETAQGTTKNKMLACAASYPSGEWAKKDTSLLDLRPAHIIELRKGLNPLPAAVNEINALSEMFEGDFLLGDAANEAFLKSNASDYGIIHLAMHGILNNRVPMLSALAFTENRDSLEDNLLQAYEIAHLQLNADLVVLSACETGYGKFEDGEGIVSLARSFMYAGTPSLVVSLWQVNDESTARIMSAFYTGLAAGKTKDKALSDAKKEYIKNTKGIAAHPVFWSAFIQLGDQKAINIASKRSGIGLKIGLAILLLFIGIVIIRKRKEVTP